MTVKNNRPLQDTDPILSNEKGPAEFRTRRAYSKLTVSGKGLLQSWDGTGWDVGVKFTESMTIVPAGKFQITLKRAGNVSVQESVLY